MQRTVGISSHGVGERAAAIDPETPEYGRWLGAASSTIPVRDT